ncbi:MAG: M1 family metallopeptidase [Acidobacteria bacterium]|nr:M1 family metallopeptidase [Acidobacteriota bacterium]
MRSRVTLRLALVLAAGVGLLAQAWLPRRAHTRTPVPRPPLPALEASYTLPPLPEASPRIANYEIDARLDAAARRIDGTLVLTWRNTSGVPLRTFPFHLYWNAFRNDLSSSARGPRRRPLTPPYSEEERDRRRGYTHVRSVRLLGASEADLTPTLRFVQPDDGNADDRTVMEVRTPAPVAPGETVRFGIDWTSQIPYGDRGRAGWVHDYHFIVQWFPKIGVFWNGAWNCHQFHTNTEFFADFGTYDVKLTLPDGFVVGATGTLQGEPARNPDGSRTFRFRQDDVHDFAWTASRRFVERRGRFDDPGYPPVDVRLLVQPEHTHLADRYIAATKIALRTYGAWSAPYPYGHVTVVDPAWRSASGGMEYPTLLTGGTHVVAPFVLHSPENVTIHETGHQFWYGLVANNEFEEAWLDEGLNTYHTAKAVDWALGPVGWGRRYFGPVLEGSRRGWPVVAPGVRLGRGESRLEGLRANGKTDVMARRGWEYRTATSYTLNSYGKPALTLQTLEGLVGEEAMTRILRTYARRFRFGHPTTRDFIATVDDVTGQDYGWFFEETFFSSNLCDYAVSVETGRPRILEGFADGPGGAPVPARAPRPEAGATEGGDFESTVTVLRIGEVRLPVEVLVEFGDAHTVLESWDGEDRWTRFRYLRAGPVVRAVVDPARKIALDVDPSNNSWVEETGRARRAARKWAARWMFWLQNLLELHAILG